MRPADLRFLAPHPVRSVSLWGSALRHREAYAAAGLAIAASTWPADDPGSVVDLAVCDARHASAARGSGARTIVLLGRPAGVRSRHPGWQVTAYLRRSGPSGPTLLAPVHPVVRHFLAHTWARQNSTSQRLRSLALTSPAAYAAADVTVASRVPGPPAFIQAATDAQGISECRHWFLSLPGASDVNRIVGFGFPPHSRTPDWVVKFNRVADRSGRGEAEQAMTAALARLGPDIAARIPHVRALVDVEGVQGSVEDAVTARPLVSYLETAAKGPAVDLLDRVVAWSCTLSERTATQRTSVAALPSALVEVAGGDELWTRAQRAPTVVAHGDLGPSNVLTDGLDFTIIDWEDGSLAGEPVWDIVLLVSQSLLNLAGIAHHRADWICRLWRGDLPESTLAARWFSQAATAAGVTPGTAAAITTAHWLLLAHYRDAPSGATADHDYASAVGPRWVADERLGVEWAGPRAG